MKRFFLSILALGFISMGARAEEPTLSHASNSALIAELERRLGGHGGADTCGDKKLIPQFSCDYRQSLDLVLLNRLGETFASQNIGNFNNKENCERQASQFKSFGRFCVKKVIASCSNYSGIYPRLLVFEMGPDGIKQVSQQSASDFDDCLTKARVLNENS